MVEVVLDVDVVDVVDAVELVVASSPDASETTSCDAGSSVAVLSSAAASTSGEVVAGAGSVALWEDEDAQPAAKAANNATIAQARRQPNTALLGGRVHFSGEGGIG